MCSYQIDRLEIMNHEVKSQEARDRIKVRQEAIEDLKKQQQVLEQEEKDLQKEYEEIILRIADSGYARLESDLDTLNETLERLNNGKVRWGADCRASEGMDGERHYAKSGDLGYRKIRRRKAFPKKSLCACRKALKDLQEELEDQRQGSGCRPSPDQERRERGKSRIKRTEAGKEGLSERAGRGEIRTA